MVMMAAGRISRHIVVVVIMMLMSDWRMINRAFFPVLAMAMLIQSDDSLASAIAVVVEDATRQLHHEHRQKGECSGGAFGRAGKHDGQVTNG